MDDSVYEAAVFTKQQEEFDTATAKLAMFMEIIEQDETKIRMLQQLVREAKDLVEQCKLMNPAEITRRLSEYV